MRRPVPIDAIGRGGFRVAGVWRPGSLLILNDAPRSWRPERLDDLGVDDFSAVLQAEAGAVELVLLGAGPVQAMPPRPVREALRAAGLGLEFMATEAAAKLHNVLSSEGRRFATALISIP